MRTWPIPAPRPDGFADRPPDAHVTDCQIAASNLTFFLSTFLIRRASQNPPSELGLGQLEGGFVALRPPDVGVDVGKGGHAFGLLRPCIDSLSL